MTSSFDIIIVDKSNRVIGATCSGSENKLVIICRQAPKHGNTTTFALVNGFNKKPKKKSEIQNFEEKIKQVHINLERLTPKG